MSSTETKIILKKSEIPPENVKVVEAGDQSIAVFNVDGRYHAILNECLHKGAPLSDGRLKSGIIVCPWHGWQFDLETGSSVVNPDVKIKKFDLKVEGDEIHLSL